MDAGKKKEDATEGGRTRVGDGVASKGCDGRKNGI